MHAKRAHIENGAVVVDEPLDLPEGTPVRIVLDGFGDFTASERGQIDAALDEADDDIKAGREHSEEEMWTRLKSVK